MHFAVKNIKHSLDCGNMKKYVVLKKKHLKDLQNQLRNTSENQLPSENHFKTSEKDTVGSRPLLVVGMIGMIHPNGG